MRLILTAIGVLVGLGLVAISATLSFLFCHSLGGTPTESLAYGSAAAGLDILKALAPFYAAWHWRKRQLTGAGAAILLWIVAVTVSVTSAMGLAAQNRLGKSGGHETLQAQFNDTQLQLAEQRRKLAAIPAARPMKEVEAELQGILTRPLTGAKRVRTLATATDHCARPDRFTASACIEVSTLKTELARAEARAELEGKIDRLRGRLDALRGRGAGEGSDPDLQASVIVRALQTATGVTASVPTVQTALIALIAIAIEVAATCSLYAALGSHGGLPPGLVSRSPQQRREPPTPTCTTSAYCDARLVSQQGSRLSMGQIQRDYEAWCQTQGMMPIERQEFLRELRREGQGRGWSIAGGVIHGIGLCS